jgi:hypothetical protein
VGIILLYLGREGQSAAARSERPHARAERSEGRDGRLDYAVAVTAADFRRIALSFDGAEEGSHMGAVQRIPFR